MVVKVLCWWPLLEIFLYRNNNNNVFSSIVYDVYKLYNTYLLPIVCLLETWKVYKGVYKSYYYTIVISYELHTIGFKNYLKYIALLSYRMFLSKYIFKKDYVLVQTALLFTFCKIFVKQKETQYKINSIICIWNKME